MLSRPRMNARHRDAPCGSWRVAAMLGSPAGRARTDGRRAHGVFLDVMGHLTGAP